MLRRDNTGEGKICHARDEVRQDIPARTASRLGCLAHGKVTRTGCPPSPQTLMGTIGTMEGACVLRKATTICAHASSPPVAPAAPSPCSEHQCDSLPSDHRDAGNDVLRFTHGRLLQGREGLAMESVDWRTKSSSAKIARKNQRPILWTHDIDDLIARGREMAKCYQGCGSNTDVFLQLALRSRLHQWRSISCKERMASR